MCNLKLGSRYSMVSFLFVNELRELSKASRFILFISLLFFMVLCFKYYQYVDNSIMNTRLDDITSIYLLDMEVEGYLNESNQQKLIEELKNIGLSSISIEETTKQRMRNNIVILKVKANYKNKEIEKEKISKYYLLD
ncbi:hypothetical protein [Clostridium tertium]|uniref:hypothetical protein n=1 Tax=Clostridium tertium TaxID=1559 RepID=UPI00202800AC|nr:hypothetical protein [Clostridium tertium]